MADISNNWMFKWEELQNSPSRKDGMTWECEKGVRHDSCIFILEIGKHLRRGKTDNAAFIRDSAACILFHRFFTAQSFKSHNRLIVGAACVFLAGKIEGCFRHLSDIVRVYCTVRGMLRDKESPAAEAVMKEQQEMVLIAERVILHTLCFDMHIEHHFKPLASKLQTDLKMYIPQDTRVAVTNSALSFMRDSFGTVLCLLYPAHLRAAGALFLAILQLGLSPQLQRLGGSGSEGLGKSWFELFNKDIAEEDLQSICAHIIDVYESKSWKPRSEASPPDINNLKTQLVSFFDGGASDQPASACQSNASDHHNNSSASDKITIPAPVKKIENQTTLVEKNRKNSPYYDMYSFSSSNSLCRGSDDGAEATPRRLPPTSTCPPTPDFVPPPPLLLSTSSRGPAPAASLARAAPASAPLQAPPPTPDFLPPPPTPDFLPPPPMPPAAASAPQAAASPSPDYLPPPPFPPSQQQQQRPLSAGCMSGMSSGLLRDDGSANGSGKTPASQLNSSSKRAYGHSNGFGCSGSTDRLHEHRRSSGSLSNGSICSPGSPSAYCSPPQSEEDNDAAAAANKRARLAQSYGSDSRLLP